MSSIKTNIINKIKSSPRFGDLFVTKNLQELLKERRFLFFTKRGPIEVVFNLKHYLSGFIISLMVAFKIMQFLIFGVFNIFTTFVINKNVTTQTQQFTEKEVEALKDLAETVIVSIPDRQENNFFEDEKKEENKSIVDQDIIFDDNLQRTSTNFTEKFIEKIDGFKNYISTFKDKNNFSDESIFDDFASLASPEMIPIEQTLKSNIISKVKDFEESKGKIIRRNKFSYNELPVLPFAAPRNSKTKMIQFSKTIDLEILELVNVFKTLKLKPDAIDLTQIESFNNENNFTTSDTDLIEQLSFRFNYLEKLKDAIIFLPLKPPMQYYYVSSPFGMRVHPKTKKKQLHKGIDMAGTWQEEVRAAANGVVSFSGRFGSFGKVVKIKHKHHVTTLYGHLHKLSVKKGESVQEGQIIGKMGATGRVAGAHLHYEIKVKNKSVNPYDFISIGRNLLSSSIIK